jgi:hypothetical protein
VTQERPIEWEPQPQAGASGRPVWWIREGGFGVRRDEDGTWSPVTRDGEVLLAMKTSDREQAEGIAVLYEVGRRNAPPVEDAAGLWNAPPEERGGALRYWLKSDVYGIESSGEALWTVVCSDGRVLSRPMDEESARRLAERFSERGED